MTTARRSLGEQLKEAGLTPFLVNHRVKGDLFNFAWPERKLGVIITDRPEEDISKVKSDWNVYQVSSNLAKNGDARQVIEMLLEGK